MITGLPFSREKGVSAGISSSLARVGRLARPSARVTALLFTPGGLIILAGRTAYLVLEGLCYGKETA